MRSIAGRLTAWLVSVHRARDAYQRHGLAYYPKLLCAVPFTPVPGSRLLVSDASLRPVLLAAIEQLARESGASSIHLLFQDEADQRSASDAGWMPRSTVQFHWTNRQPEPYADFDDFLTGMQHDKRKKIRQERRKVASAGVEFTHRSGREISTADWDYFYRCANQSSWTNVVRTSAIEARSLPGAKERSS